MGMKTVKWHAVTENGAPIAIFKLFRDAKKFRGQMDWKRLTNSTIRPVELKPKRRKS